MAVPSMKGTAFEALAGDLKRLVDEGRIPPERLEVDLTAEDLRLLENKVLPSSWYPITSCERFLALLLEFEGCGRPEYLVERGAKAERRIANMGIYAQLAAARRAQDCSEHWLGPVGGMMTSLSGAMFNFARWRFTPPRREVAAVQHRGLRGHPLSRQPALRDRGLHPGDRQSVQ